MDFNFTSLYKRFSLDYQPIDEADEESNTRPRASPCVRASRSAAVATGVVICVVALLKVASPYITIGKRGNIQALKANPSDFIPSVPLFGSPPSPQWSGLLDASASTPGTYLHYWFAHYDGDNTPNGKRNVVSSDSSIPLIVWFNGGPGSSSLFGWLTELGPLLLKTNGTGLLKNPYSWTKLGHVVALESPAGVGYSYCQNWTLPERQPCINTDITTARDAHAALKNFVTTKFPMLKNNPLYLTGESYAGVYVPTLAKEILDQNDQVQADEKLNLQGIAAGDPCTDNKAQAQGFDMMWYSHKYGLITDGLYSTLKDTCGLVTPPMNSRGVYFSDPKKNAQVVREIQQQVLKEHEEHLKHNGGQRRLEDGDDDDDDDDDGYGLDMSEQCRLAFRKFLVATSMGIDQEFKERWINPFALYEKVDHFQDASLNNYMSRSDVQAIMHVNTKVTPKWTGDVDDTDSTPWEYYSSYDACNGQPLPNGTWSMVDFYVDLAPRLKRTIVYNGDSDPCVTYEGTRIAIEEVGFPVLKGGDYRPWFYDSKPTAKEVVLNRPLGFGSMLTTQDGGPQYGGSVVDYENHLSFASIHGSGHMVPETRPQATLQFLRRALLQQGGTADGLLSPLYGVSDHQMESMNGTEFEDFVSRWTRAAMDLSLIV